MKGNSTIVRCDFHTSHPPGMAAHIRGNHPGLWKGNLQKTLGYTMRKDTDTDCPLRKGGLLPRPTSMALPPLLELDETHKPGRKRTVTTDPAREERLRRKRIYNAGYRLRKKGLKVQPSVWRATDETAPPAEKLIHRCPKCGCDLVEALNELLGRLQ